MFCLKVPSDPQWAEGALASFDDVLVDHAHCEMKAASNALSLVLRQSENMPLVMALAELAREELEHFQRVLALLSRRGLRLGPPPVDPYAAALRTAALALPSSSLGGLVDRLLVAAIIEARSCERFKLLLGRLDPLTQPELHEVYTELFASEARHYRTFVNLAVQAAGGDSAADVVDARLEALSHVEARIVMALTENDARASVHG